VEDTDQTRYVKGAEQYIGDCLSWCGISPDEGPQKGGAYGPYRQSERKDRYRQYAEQLVRSGHAYYAFDTPEEIESLREKLKAEGKYNVQYDFHNRLQMRNSLTLSAEETQKLFAAGVPHVIRIKMPPDESVHFKDMIRGDIETATDGVDDKVLLKADGMPTYHLAVVVDDYQMKITHAFRGEEWLPSAPVHVLLWKYLGWEKDMPSWAHLPLILKPDGNGKLSKRDGERLGFPVFALEWNDPVKGVTMGFRELGFMPEAFVNMLAMLGWNDGTEQEIFSLDELVGKFSVDRIHAHGAKFDFEKAKWFNHEWIKKSDAKRLQGDVKKIFEDHHIPVTDDTLFTKVIELIKERCTLLTDFVQQGSFFFIAPAQIDAPAILPKWGDSKNQFFVELIRIYSQMDAWTVPDLEHTFKELAAASKLKPGELMFPFRIMLVGGKFGPGVFEISSLIGKEQTIKRIEHALPLLK
jgi:glutamyl-tRNA synthetase